MIYKKSMRAIIATLLVFCNVCFGNFPASYEEARQKAELEGKPLLIIFLGPNWCPFSDQLEADVLEDSTFLEEIGKQLVLFKVDIPEDFDQESYSGAELKKQFHIEECPSLVLAKPNGEEIAKLPYLPIEHKDFIGSIRGTLADYQKVSRLTKDQLKTLQIEEIKALYSKAGRLADETFKKVLLEQGLKSDSSPYFLIEKYGDLLTSSKVNRFRLKMLRKKIASRDPENLEGYQRKLAVMDFEALASVKKNLKAEAVVEPLVQYLANFGKKDPENAWEIEMKISQYFFTHSKIEDALRHAKISLELAPKEYKEDIAQSIEYLQSYIN